MSTMPSPVTAENVIPFQEMRALCREYRLPDQPATLIAEYAMQRFDDCIFGPAKWLAHFDAIPVTLPSIDSLRSRASYHVRLHGIEPPKPVQEMRVEECANLLGITGDEDRPEIPEELHFCLNNPVRPGERVAGLTCAVTYIPEYIRKGGKVMAVTSRTLNALVTPQTIEEALQPRNPKLGYPSSFFMDKYSLDEALTEQGADGTQPPCYFVMELEFATNGKVKRGEAALPEGWEFPETRNFAASVFTRCAWKAPVPLGRTDAAMIHIHGKEIGKTDKTPLVLGVATARRELGARFMVVCAESYDSDNESSACGSKQYVLGSIKFPVR